jgi:hypothetical protein
MPADERRRRVTPTAVRPSTSLQPSSPQLSVIVQKEQVLAARPVLGKSLQTHVTLLLLHQCYFALRYKTSILAPLGNGLTLVSRSSSPDRLIPLLKSVPSSSGLSAASNCWRRSFSASLTLHVPALAAKKSSVAAASSSTVGSPGDLDFGRSARATTCAYRPLESKIRKPFGFAISRFVPLGAISDHETIVHVPTSCSLRVPCWELRLLGNSASPSAATAGNVKIRRRSMAILLGDGTARDARRSRARKAAKTATTGPCR